MRIDNGMISEIILESFNRKIPKRLADYWNETYAENDYENIGDYNTLNRILCSEYNAYLIGIKDSEQRYEITCEKCMAANKFTRETGYRLELVSH